MVPHAFLCPISLEQMRDPVVAADGHTYERSEISEWLRHRHTSPLTNLPLATRALLPNIALHKSMEEWSATTLGGALYVHPSRVSVTSGDVLGEGCFGRVLAATMDGAARVAIKTMPAMSLEEQRRQVAEEARVHLAAQRASCGVCALIGTMDGGYGVCLVMRRYRQSLADYIRNSGTLRDAKIRSIGHSLCCTLSELHDAGIIMQDIKPANVLLDAHDRPVFSDFGIASIGAPAAHTSMKGTFNYMAPEAFDPPLDTKADIWSMACLLLEMHTGRQPWEGMQMQHIVTTVLVKRHTPIVPARMPAAPAVRRCFSFVPAQRPDAATLALALCPVDEAERREAESEATLDAVLNANEAKVNDLRSRLARVQRELSEIGKPCAGEDIDEHPLFDERRVHAAIARPEIRVIVVYGHAGSGRHELAAMVVRALHTKHGLADIRTIDYTRGDEDWVSVSVDEAMGAKDGRVTVFVLGNDDAYSVSKRALGAKWTYSKHQKLEREDAAIRARREIALLCATQMYLHPGQWALHAPHQELESWLSHVRVYTFAQAAHLAQVVSIADTMVSRAAAAHDDRLVDAATGAMVDSWLGSELRAASHPAQRALPYVFV